MNVMRFKDTTNCLACLIEHGVERNPIAHVSLINVQCTDNVVHACLIRLQHLFVLLLLRCSLSCS